MNPSADIPTRQAQALPRYSIPALAITLFSIVTPTPTRAELQRAAFWDVPEPVQILNEAKVDEVCQFQWGATYNLFDYPAAVCSRQYINGGNTVGDYFVLDKGQNKIRLLGTRVLGGIRKLAFVREISGGFKSPESITLGTSFAYGHRQLYIADSGNNRIGRSELDYSTGIPYPLPVSYIYSGSGNAGPLRQPHDIDYCEYHDPQVGDLLLVADTYHHRVLGMNTQGVVQWTVGNGQPGNGTMQFKYPYAVTGASVDDYSGDAFVYVGDRGNDRVVRLHVSGVSTVEWDGAFAFGGGSAIQDAGPGFAGIEDVEVDDTDLLRNGVFVLHSGLGKVVQLDHELEAVLQAESNFAERGALYDLDSSRGMLSVLTPYTQVAGMELFVVPASVVELAASSDSFVYGSGTVQITFGVTSASALDVWVERVDALPPAIVRGLLTGLDVTASWQAVVWDGSNDAGQPVASGLYRIKCRATDEYTTAPNVDSVDVECFTAPHVIHVSASGAGEFTAIQQLSLLPLVHPRQADRLGTHSAWWEIHDLWAKKTAPSLLRLKKETG